MTEIDKQLLSDLNCGMITTEEFLMTFSIDVKSNPEFVRKEILTAIERHDPNEIQCILGLIWASDDIFPFVDLLNELLINPNHRSHQQIAKNLQDYAPSPSTVPFVRKALESKFDYLEYTCSESNVIAKWFSWLLYSIGTKEAIELMKEYSDSNDEGIRDEMRYRLRKVDVNN